MRAIEQKTAESIYLEYLNDWLTVEKMAEYYSITAEEMNDRINKGRDEHLQKFATT